MELPKGLNPGEPKNKEDEMETTDQTAAPAKKKPAKAKAASPKEGIAEAQARIKELEARVAAGEEAALARVCKALNIDPATVNATKDAEPEQMIRCFVSNPIHINGKAYSGDVTVPYGVFEMLQEMLGKRRQRLLRELTGNNYMLTELQGGGMTPVLVGKVDATGERIQ